MSERPEGAGEMGNAAPKPVNPIEESRGPATAVPAPVPAPAVPVPAAADTAVPSDNAPDTAMTPADQPTAVSRSAPAAPLEAQSTMPEGTPAPAQMTVSPAATLGALSTGKDATLLIDSAAKPQDPAVTAAMDTSEKNTAPVAASAPSPTASNAATAPTATSVLPEAISAPVPALKEEPAPKHVQGSPPKCKPEPANTTAKTATSSQRDTPQPIALASVVSGASAQEAEPLRVEGSASAKTTSPIITTPSSVQPAPSGSEAASNSNTGSSSAEPMELSDVPKPPAAATVEAPQALLVPEPPPVDAQVHLAGAPQPTAGSTSGVQETLPMDTASGHSPAPAKDQVVLASVASAAPANPTNLSPVSTNGHAAPVSVRTAPKQLQETNLYALQHEKDAVHWYPWGSDAFDLATKENKPIFLSIGYSTCHWCHVMARECFQNKEIAAAMNERFINIQVDREERPDIDAIYMLYVQATTGSGGWPMSVWLTPTLKPILGGTYFPPKDAQNRPGFMTLVRRVADAWKTKSKELEAEGSEAVKQLRQHLSRATVPKSGLKPPTNGVLEKTFESIRKTYDPKKGGFSSAPKFPRPAVFQFLSFYYRSMPNTTESKAAIDMASFTLEKMARGGIHDVVGGGFHRYSVTSDFHIPHFEKTLVDNAQLAVSYLEAYQCTKNEEFADVARKTLRYIVNEMRAPEGGYFAAEDADSEGLDGKLQEGGYYLWKYSEMEGILGQDAKLICELFNVTESGNAPVNADPQGRFKNANILIQRQDLSTIAKKQPSRDVAGVVRNGMEKLLAARKHRKRPTIDNKIIAGWNGLAIWALARGYQVLGDKAWLEAALETAKCIHQTLYDVSSKRLVRSFHSERGKSHAAGFASDYAFLIQGLIELYQITFDPYWLRWAIDLQQTQQQLFFDAATGAYWNAVDDHTLLFRTKEDYDGAEPSTNSVSASNLLKLSQLLPDSTEFRRLAEGVVAAFEEQLTKSPLVLPLLSTVAHMLAHPTVQVLLYSPPVGEKDEKYAEDTAAKRLQEMAQVVYAAVLPNKTLVVFDENRRDDSMQWLLSNASSRVGALRSSSQVAAYVCVGGTCKAPVSSADELRAALAVGVGN